MRMERKITRVDTLPQFDKSLSNVSKLRRVAAYARVSTDKKEQQNSYENQLDYYPKLVANRPNWEFITLYSDEGISATSTKNRDGFNQLISDALDKKFDLIITKSISRFARNTVDSLTTVRKLKAAGVEVWFEKEDLFSFDSKGEFMLTLLSSLAQEESRSISENTTWAIRKNMADGIYSMPYSHFLGYKKGENGGPTVVEEEAAVVKRIYRMFLQRYSAGSIAKILTSEGVPSPSGKAQWRQAVITNILRNEKYKGAALLQKKYTVDFMTKKQILNRGELAQYWVGNGHEAIVSDVVFDTVQKIFAGKSSCRTNPHCGFLSNMVFCGKCGDIFVRYIIGNYKSPYKYKHVSWRCSQVYGKQQKCHASHIYEEVVAFLFNQAIIEILHENPEIAATCRKIIASTVSKKKMPAVDEFLSRVSSLSPLNLPFEEGIWRTIIKRAEILPDDILRLYFNSGEVKEFTMPKYSNIRNNFMTGSVLEESLKCQSLF